MVRFLNLAVLFTLVFTSSLYGAKPAKILGPQDIVTVYRLSPQKKNELYDAYVRNHIPGKTKPDNYHVTLGWVKDVHPKDHSLLQKHLQKIADNYLNSTTFTVDSIKRYVVNRGLNGGLVLVPKANEVRKFRVINQHLHRELQKFNTKHHCRYAFHRDVEVPLFDPHITIANTSHIQQFGINRDQAIKDITLKIKAKPLEVLHSPIRNPMVKKLTPVSKNTQIKNKKTRKTASRAFANKRIRKHASAANKTTKRAKTKPNKVTAKKPTFPGQKTKVPIKKLKIKITKKKPLAKTALKKK
ncbi:MAG: hypothetical protein K2P93_05280 [Alphaproteobacteria bacterium]|nr:hypothetical protein [Alphaproteobacteria bacterium]